MRLQVVEHFYFFAESGLLVLGDGLERLLFFLLLLSLLSILFLYLGFGLRRLVLPELLEEPQLELVQDSDCARAGVLQRVPQQEVVRDVVDNMLEILAKLFDGLVAIVLEVLLDFCKGDPLARDVLEVEEAGLIAVDDEEGN